MKVALVHDSLCGTGGAEKVFESICKIFPSSDIYTLAYNKSKTSPYFKSRKIRVSILNPVCQSMETVRWFYLLSPFAMRLFDLSHYDLIISSSTTVAKHVLGTNSIHICYCYYPPRAIWFPSNYFQSSWKKRVFSPFLNYLRNRDLLAASRVSYFITQSPDAQSMISKIYNRFAPIFPGPSSFVDMSTETPAPDLSTRSDRYLLVSRLEPWKTVDYVIEAFNHMPDRCLDIVGVGSDMKRLSLLCKGDNIRFLGWQSEHTLLSIFRESRALIFPPDLEYGLVPIEANASGLPVIAFDSPGVQFTQISFRPDLI